MPERVAFLNKAYSAYHHRGLPPADEELTRVGPGTPGGEYLRRFWQPVVLTSELGELPKRLRILGEDLVAFRDKSGAAGLLELHCPHRGTSLEFGLIGETGIRCCYHGWLFGCDGAILETPGEPADSTLKERLFHGAYPVHEHAGLVFAYMGPPELQPPFPMLDTLELPGYQLVPRTPSLWECNWVQVKENAMDPAHLQFLHTLPGSKGFVDDFKTHPEWDWMETPVGMVYIDTRRQDDPGLGYASPILSRRTFTNSRPTTRCWHRATRSAGRKQRSGRCRLTTRTRCRWAITALPRARKHAAASGSDRMAAVPMRNASVFRAITTLRSASITARHGTGSNISPRPIAASS